MQDETDLECDGGTTWRPSGLTTVVTRSVTRSVSPVRRRSLDGARMEDPAVRVPDPMQDYTYKPYTPRESPRLLGQPLSIDRADSPLSNDQAADELSSIFGEF